MIFNESAAPAPTSNTAAAMAKAGCDSHGAGASPVASRETRGAHDVLADARRDLDIAQLAVDLSRQAEALQLGEQRGLGVESFLDAGPVLGAQLVVQVGDEQVCVGCGLHRVSSAGAFEVPNVSALRSVLSMGDLLTTGALSDFARVVLVERDAPEVCEVIAQGRQRVAHA